VLIDTMANMHKDPYAMYGEDDDDGQRATGRTKKLALKYVLEALEHPGQRVQLKDHWDDLRGHSHLAGICTHLGRSLGLKELVFEKTPMGDFFIWFNKGGKA